MSAWQKTREVPLSQGAVSDAYLIGRKVLPVANISYWDFMSVLFCAYLRPRKKKSMAILPALRRLIQSGCCDLKSVTAMVS